MAGKRGARSRSTAESGNLNGDRLDSPTINADVVGNTSLVRKGDTAEAAPKSETAKTSDTAKAEKVEAVKKASESSKDDKG